MGSVVPILLLGLAGLLLGGVFSLRSNGAPKAAILVTGALAVVAAVGGVLWLLPE